MFKPSLILCYGYLEQRRSKGISIEAKVHENLVSVWNTCWWALIGVPTLNTTVLRLSFVHTHTHTVNLLSVPCLAGACI